MLRSLKNSFTAPLKGFKYLWNNPKLIRFAMMPLLINVILYMGFITLAYYAVPGIMNKLLGKPEVWWQFIFYYLIGSVLVVSVIFILIFTFSIVANIIAAPFNEILTKKILIANGYKFEGSDTEQKGVRAVLKDLQRVIVIESKKALLLVFVLIISSLINLIPILSFISLAVTALLIGYNYIDYSLELEKKTFTERLKFTIKNIWPITAFGASTALIFVVPFLNLLLIPMAVSGAALIYQDLATSSTNLPTQKDAS